MTPRSPRIIHVTTADMALRYLLLNQLRYIEEQGYEVTGVSNPGPYVEELVDAGLDYHPVSITRNFTPFQDLRSFWRLYRLFRMERPEVVHTHNPKPGLLGQLAARAAGVPFVVNTLHGFYFHDHMHPLVRRFYIWMEKIAARCSDVILSQNSEDIQTAIREGICSAELIRPLGNGIDLERFDPDRFPGQQRTQMRQSLNIPPDVPVVGFVGRMVREKGICEFMEAAAVVRARYPDARFLVTGMFDAVKSDAFDPSIAREHGLEDACTFTGERQDMPELYSVMDVFVLPTYREGFPRAPMEASAMGVPCVVTDIRGCRETVIDGHNGFLVEVRNGTATGEAVLRILGDDRLRTQLGRNGRLLAAERFDERKVFERVVAEYRRLLGGPEVQPDVILSALSS